MGPKKIWKALEVSRGSLSPCACCFADANARRLYAVVTSTTETSFPSLQLVLCTVGELGFPEGGTFSEILKSASRGGLMVLPQETAVRLLHASNNRGSPRGGVAWVVSKPIALRGSEKYLLGIGRVWTKWLRSRTIEKETRLGPRELLVFGVQRDISFLGLS